MVARPARHAQAQVPARQQHHLQLPLLARPAPLPPLRDCAVVRTPPLKIIVALAAGLHVVDLAAIAAASEGMLKVGAEGVGGSFVGLGEAPPDIVLRH
ncbi:RING-type domain-containing protein [Psidium guajava]|nr:RING-type domain-containing protein [Psidium guajava]